MSFEIKNIVLLYILKNSININLLNPNYKFNKTTLNGFVYRSTEPKAFLRIYKNGKIVVTGVKSLGISDLVVERFLDTVNLPKTYTRTIVNIVGTMHFNIRINLANISQANSRIQYEPELFPGACYKFLNSKAKAIIFSNSKVNLLGAKSLSEIKLMSREINDFILSFSSNELIKECETSFLPHLHHQPRYHDQLNDTMNKHYWIKDDLAPL